MTHDKLRDYIDKFDAAGMVKEPVVAALRAVVELHKPSFAIVNGVKGDEWCYQCAEQRSYAKYPCNTIQAIEKELG